MSNEMYFNRVTGRRGKLICIEIYDEQLGEPVRILKSDLDLDAFDSTRLQEIVPDSKFMLRKCKRLNDNWKLVLDMPEYTDEQLEEICNNIR